MEEEKPYWNADPKPIKKEKAPYKGLKRTPIKYKPKGNTDEFDFMMQVFTLRGGKCEVSGVQLEFSPSACHHLLNKNNYKRFRLEPRNLIIIHPEIHFLYHNASKEYLLDQYPNAIILFERAEKLRIEYNAPKETI